MSEGKKSGFLENPVFITIMLFFVFFAAGLPLLWRSSRFTYAQKWLFTLLSLAETVIIINNASVLIKKIFDRLDYIGGIAGSF